MLYPDDRLIWCSKVDSGPRSLPNTQSLYSLYSEVQCIMCNSRMGPQWMDRHTPVKPLPSRNYVGGRYQSEIELFSPWPIIADKVHGVLCSPAGFWIVDFITHLEATTHFFCVAPHHLVQRKTRVIVFASPYLL